MPNAPLTKESRDAIVARVRDLDRRLNPPKGAPEPSDDEAALIEEQYYATMGEYFDRLPRMTLSVCPYCARPLKRVFDPFGLDGFFWATDLLCEVEEPAACEHFRVLLGALSLGGREPVEVVEEVRPGPEVPFVVPALFELPGMVAVVGKLALARGDAAYPIGYFSNQPTDPSDLHQPWLRTSYWFAGEDGEAVWMTANDIWDFALEPHLAAGRLRWTLLEDKKPRAASLEPGARCPFAGLRGERRPQQLVGGARDFLPPPDGRTLNPFES